MALISQEYVTSVLDYSENQNEQVSLLLAWVESKAESIIGRKLSLAEYTWYLDGNWGEKIILPVRPIVSVDAVYIDSVRTFGDALSEDSYYVDTESGIVTLFRNLVPKGHRVVKIVATAGYDEDSFPADLKMAFLEAISWNMSRMLDRSFGRTNQSTPDGMTVGYEMVLPMGVQRAFESYRDVRV